MLTKYQVCCAWAAECEDLRRDTELLPEELVDLLVDIPALDVGANLEFVQ